MAIKYFCDACGEEVNHSEFLYEFSAYLEKPKDRGSGKDPEGLTTTSLCSRCRKHLKKSIVDIIKNILNELKDKR